MRNCLSSKRSLGVALPVDYRQYVLDYNGGYFDDPLITPVSDDCPLETLTYMCGIASPHPGAELGRSDRLALFDGNDPPLILPIGYTGLGAFIILRDRLEGRGTIFLKEAGGGFYYLAEGIEEFFDLLHSPDSPAVNRGRP